MGVRPPVEGSEVVVGMIAAVTEFEGALACGSAIGPQALTEVLGGLEPCLIGCQGNAVATRLDRRTR